MNEKDEDLKRSHISELEKCVHLFFHRSVLTVLFRLKETISNLQLQIARLPNAVQHPIEHRKQRRENLSEIKIQTSEVVNATREFKVWQSASVTF